MSRLSVVAEEYSPSADWLFLLSMDLPGLSAALSLPGCQGKGAIAEGIRCLRTEDYRPCLPGWIG